MWQACVFGKGGAVANANTNINTEDSDEIRSRRNASVFREGGTVDEEEDLLCRGRPQVGPGIFLIVMLTMTIKIDFVMWPYSIWIFFIW